MSNRCDCWDNVPCESWFGKLKSEWIDPQDAFATRQDAELAIVETIAMFDNGKRIHQALDDQTPNACEAKYSDTLLELTAKSKGVDRKGKWTGLRRCDDVRLSPKIIRQEI
jgi:transposase InsO family protein